MRALIERMRPPQADPALLGAVLALTAIGVVMVYSAGVIFAQRSFGDGAWLLKRHVVYVIAGLLGLFAVMRLDYRRLERLAVPLVVLCVALLIATQIPGIGVRSGGAQRWLRLGGFTFQPAELCKLVVIIYAARVLADHARAVGGPIAPSQALAVRALPLALIMGLTLLQPDFGSVMVYSFILFAMLFVAGIRLGYFFLGALAALPFVYYLIISTPYRLKRVLAFLNPWEFRFDIGYQLSESLLSLGSGGVSGLGLGGGKQKLLFLPSAHNDFIMAAVGEELGFVGVCTVIALFLLIGARGLRAAWRSEDPFGLYLGFGVTFLLLLQAVLHIGVVMGVLPAKGLTLPFVSYGGSSLLVCLAAAGILLSVAAGGRVAGGKGATA